MLNVSEENKHSISSVSSAAAWAFDRRSKAVPLIFLVDNIVTFEDSAGLIAGYFHGHAFRCSCS
jgi:hypothetical protein